jgi:hypothetical protein
MTMIELSIHTQPDDESCGPTSLHAVYKYYGLDIPLDEVVKTVDRSFSGGTLSPMLGKHALQRGFNATIYVYNLLIYDPTWFEPHVYSKEKLMEKLQLQLEYKPDLYLGKVTDALLEFLSLGGEVRFKTLTVHLLQEYFHKKTPIITGLSATYLYNTARERFTRDGKSIYDDIRGTPCGHFVVLCGYDDVKKHIVVADPHKENPLSHDNYYKVYSQRLINAIMLGVLTYDANLLIITPKGT